MKETLSSISQRTGISITTISRVLGGKAEKYRISEKTAAIVEAEAQKCNYTPSLLAKSLRTNKTNTIGLMLPTMSNPYFADIASNIITAAKEKGYSTLIVDTMEDETNQSRCISALISRKVDGIIAAPCGKDPKLLEEVDKTVAPVVLVDRYFEGSSLPHVTSNNFKGAFEATEYLIRNGHTRIACIQGNPDSMTSRRRINGYLASLKRHSLESESIVVGDSYSIQNGYLEGKLLLNMTNRPSAIFALSYNILLGVLKAIHDSGLKIPDDISLIGFDDNLSLDYMLPSVSRVSQPLEEMSKLATKILIERIQDKERPTSQLELTTSLLIRDSVAILPVSKNNF